MIAQPVKEDREKSPVPVLISHNGHIYYLFIYRMVHLNLKRKEMFQWNITVSCGLTQVCSSVNRTELLILVLNDMIIYVRRTRKKLQVPDGIWTHDPPDLVRCSNHWATEDSGEQGPICGSWLELHHVATQPSNDW